jgi:hypothetical protein
MASGRDNGGTGVTGWSLISVSPVGITAGYVIRLASAAHPGGGRREVMDRNDLGKWCVAGAGDLGDRRARSGPEAVAAARMVCGLPMVVMGT